MTSELINKTACETVDLLKTGEVTPTDLLDTLEARIAEVEPAVNALPTLCFDRARERARALEALAPKDRGPLAGMPVPIKDLSDVSGVRSTNGSLIFKDTVPDTSDILVSHLEKNGAIIYAKSNTPEFGAGAHTFNEVFGATLNPWNTSRSAAGSSGGAAVALATGMAWLAHGSDMGGSLRNPASFCGVCGMRPSPGRVATTRASKVDGNLGLEVPWAATSKIWRCCLTQWLARKLATLLLYRAMARPISMRSRSGLETGPGGSQPRPWHLAG